MLEMPIRTGRRLQDAARQLREGVARRTNERQQVNSLHRQRMTCSDSLQPFSRTQDWTSGMTISPSGRFRVVEEAQPKRRAFSRARGVPKDRLMYVKHELIVKPVRHSVKESGGKRDPLTFRNILAKGVKVLLTMLKVLEHADRKTWADAWGDAFEKFMEYCITKATGMDLNKLKQEKNRGAR